MECPRCALMNPPNAVRCDCGYDFVTRTLQRSYLEERRASRSRPPDAWTSSDDDPETEQLWGRAKAALAAQVLVQLLLARPQGRAAEVPGYHVAYLLGTGVAAAVLPLVVVAIARVLSPNPTSRKTANILFATSILFLVFPIIGALTATNVHEPMRN